MICTYEGIEGAINGRISLTSGIVPNVFTINLPPIDISKIPATGTFVIGDGVRSITIPECRAESAELHRDTDTAYWRITLRDWRWKWMCDNSYYSGQYNRRDNRNVLVGTKKTLKELIDILTASLSVPDAWDAELVEVDANPYIDWDFTQTVLSLHELCQQYGLNISIRPARDATGDSKTVNCAVIYPEGRSDQTLSNDLIISGDMSLVRKPIPRDILILGGKPRYQVEISLRACCFDPDDSKWKYLDSDDTISYKPTGGWVLGLKTDDDAENKAIRETLFRCYAFPAADVGLKKYNGASSDDTLDFEDMMKFILPDINESEIVDGEYRLRSPYCKGPHCTTACFDDPSQEKTGEDDIVDVPFVIDRKLGLIRFSSVVYATDSNGVPAGASIKLVCAFAGPSSHYTTVVYQIGEKGVFDSFRFDDVIPYYIEDSMTFETAQAETTRVNTELGKRLDAEKETKYANYNSNGGRYVYSGIRPIFPDGYIDEVVFTVDPNGGPVTEVSACRTVSPYTKPRRVRENEMTDAINRKIGRDSVKGRSGAYE